jgi:3-oxoacyl-[acyl-carrier-protein] synthase II
MVHDMNSSQRVGIVGIGAVTGFGWGVESLWGGLIAGKSAAEPVGFQDCASLAVLVPDGGDEEDSITLFGRALYGSGREAVADAKARGWQPGNRVGFILCSSLGEIQGWRDLYFSEGRHLRRRHFLQLLPSTAPSMFMAEHGFKGPSLNAGAACASGALGVILARQWLTTGFASDVIVSGTDLSVTEETARHFTDLGAIVPPGLAPEQACRPFQEGSLGFIAGEASVALVLTNRPGADAYVQVLGAGYTHDAFHPIAINPDGIQVAAAWSDAIADAGVDVNDVAYVNAHGSGTTLGDTVEAAIADALFAPKTKIYSTKMLTGHGLGAGGALETAVVALAYQANEIPAPKLVATGHPRVLDGVTKRAPGATLKSSIGMGGYNAALIIDSPN